MRRIRVALLELLSSSGRFARATEPAQRVDRDDLSFLSERSTREAPSVFSREPVVRPAGAGEGAECEVEHNLNCHGYGSSVTVTATFGMVAAGEALRQIMNTGG